MTTNTENLDSVLYELKKKCKPGVSWFQWSHPPLQQGTKGQIQANLYPEGLCSAVSHRRLNLAGRERAEYLLKIFVGRGYSFTTAAERDIAWMSNRNVVTFPRTQIPNLICQEKLSVKEKTHVHKNGNIIAVGSEWFCCLELLSQSSIIENEIREVTP